MLVSRPRRFDIFALEKNSNKTKEDASSETSSVVI